MTMLLCKVWGVSRGYFQRSKCATDGEEFRVESRYDWRLFGIVYISHRIKMYCSGVCRACSVTVDRLEEKQEAGVVSNTLVLDQVYMYVQKARPDEAYYEYVYEWSAPIWKAALRTEECVLIGEHSWIRRQGVDRVPVGPPFGTMLDEIEIVDRVESTSRCSQ